MKGRVFKRCGCRNPQSGKKYAEGKCPKLRKKDHGAWWYRYEAPPGADGKRRRPLVGPFRLKKDAEDELAKELVRAGRTNQAIDRSVTVGEYLEERWLPGKKKLSRRTFGDYVEIVKLYLKPGLGHLRLVDLRDHHASELYEAAAQINRPLPDGEKPTEMLRRLLVARAESPKKQLAEGEARGRKQRKPLSASRIKKIHAVLSSAMGKAAITEKLGDNPVRHVELPRSTNRRPKPIVWTNERVTKWLETGEIPGPVMVWTAHHTAAFLDFSLEDRLYPLYHVVSFRGFRRGESVGLPWTDTDLDEAETATLHETRPDNSDEYDDTKSEAGDRTVALDKGCVLVLKDWRTRQRKERLAAGEAWIDSGRVFTNEDGSALNPDAVSRRFRDMIKRYSTVRRRYFEEGWPIERIARRHRISERAVRVAVERGPLPPIRFHDLRHGSATLSLLAKVDIKVVSDTLGHAKWSFTADTYTSVVPELAREAAEAVASVVPLRRDGPA